MVKPSERPEWIPVLHRYFQPVGDPGDVVNDYECVFGDKHDGELLSVIAEEDPQWLEWIVGANFPKEVVELLESWV